MGAVESPGCVILLLDESAGMGAVMGEIVSDGKASTRSNAERVATAVNSLLNQLSGGPSFPLALVGYQADGEHQKGEPDRCGLFRECVRGHSDCISGRHVHEEEREPEDARVGGDTAEAGR